MQAYTFGHGLCRFQNLLRPSNQCQCSTSSFAPARLPRTDQSSACHSSSSSSRRVQLVVQATSTTPVADSESQPQTTSQQPTTTPTRRKKSKRNPTWSYKYNWQPCPTACAGGDERCLMVEALIQNVLSFPNSPPRICRVLPEIQADINSMTALVEQMASHFGKELTLIYIKKQPKLLELDFSTVLERIKGFRELFGVLDSDVPLMLRKNPQLLVLPPQELRARFENVARVTQFSGVQLRAFVLKFPLVFAMQPVFVRNSVERLRQLCYTRDEWTREFNEISPSFMAYFLRDSTDQLMRLEYLASTGERPEWQLREVMKPATKSFRAKVKNFTMWEIRVKQRRAQQKAAALAAQQQATQQAEAAAIKAAILAAEETAAPAAGSPQLQQQQQVPDQQVQQ